MDAPVAAAVTVSPAARVQGRLRCPGDKSISHRYAMLAALADGHSIIERFAPGADCAATLDCLEALGVTVARHGERGLDAIIDIEGRGVGGLNAPAAPLDAGNSGTTLRLMAGILAAHPFDATLTGDASLRRRPMRRVIDPLTAMGARIAAVDDRPPLTITGGALHGITWTPPVPSAQIKSAVLLAGLGADGRTAVREPVGTRDHTERALAAFGVQVERVADWIALRGAQRLRGCRVQVPGDLSSAAVWIAAAAALPDSEIEIADVSLNPSRSHVLDILRRAGASVEATTEREAASESIGRIRVRHDGLHPLIIDPAEVPSLIDELPVLAALATHPGGGIRVTGASELRVKESDRITALVAGLRALGADARELPDGFEVQGATRLAGGTADAAGDHRLVLAFAVASLGASRPCVILGADVVSVSYPGFFDTLDSLRT